MTADDASRAWWEQIAAPAGLMTCAAFSVDIDCGPTWGDVQSVLVQA